MLSAYVVIFLLVWCANVVSLYQTNLILENNFFFFKCKLLLPFHCLLKLLNISLPFFPSHPTLMWLSVIFSIYLSRLTVFLHLSKRLPFALSALISNLPSSFRIILGYFLLLTLHWKFQTFYASLPAADISNWAVLPLWVTQFTAVLKF